MPQYGFYFNGVTCIGCKTCELACKDYHDLGAQLSFRNVYEYSGGSWTANPDGSFTQDAFKYYTSVSCNHCAAPACMGACPTAAIAKDENGIVTIDEETCIGCGSCVTACPYHAPSLDMEREKSRKCDSCISRREQGKQPICVEACLTRALEFAALDDLRSKYGSVNDIAPLPDPAKTGPGLVVTPSVRARPRTDSVGAVTNPREIF